MTPELLQEAVAEFKVIYKEEFKEDLSDHDATEKALAVLRLLEVLTTDDRRELL